MPDGATQVSMVLRGTTVKEGEMQLADHCTQWVVGHRDSRTSLIKENFEHNADIGQKNRFWKGTR
jgi:hypothetical protein